MNIRKNTTLGICILIFFGIFLSYFYIDTTSLIVWSTNIWDCVFGDGIRSYYQYTALNVQGIPHSVVGNDLLIYVPWAIWNFPIWVISKLTHTPISTNVLMLTFAKLFLVFCLCGVLYVCKQIFDLLGVHKGEQKSVLLLIITSMFTITSILYAGQNDILPILMFLIAFKGLLKNRTSSFLIFVALSIAMKPYMLFSFVILIFLTEKKFWRILGKLLAGVSLFALQKIILRSFPYYLESTSSGAARGEFVSLLKARIGVSAYPVSAFLLFFGVAAVIAYFTKYEEQKRSEYLVYFTLLPLFVLFSTAEYTFYRPFYLVPFLYFLFVQNKKVPIYFQLFLESLLIGFMGYQFYRTEMLYYNPMYMNWSFFGRLFGLEIVGGNSIAEYSGNMIAETGAFISSTFILLIFSVFAVVNHPGFQKKLDLSVWENARWVKYMRLGLTLILIGFSLIPLLF